jgi:hypothetical protein|nr:MAG TPA: tail connector protein [Caudoviricetes sp.]
MSVLEKIKSKTNKIDVESLKKRILKELNIKEDNNNGVLQVEYSLLDTLVIILDTTHQSKIPDGLYTTWLRMTKDYWYLNGYDKLFASKSEEDSKSNVKVKSVQIGDTTTTFVDKTSQVEINGIVYNTGTVNYSEDGLIEKYKKDLYRHRKMRW